MATIVALHGAWHWGTCFQKVATELQLKGHQVFMPDLATHGFDVTSASDVGDMARYTASARRIIEGSSGEIVLVAHSMGGASATYLAEQYSAKIRSVIYLTAWLTPNGKSPNDYIMSKEYQENNSAAEILQILVPDRDGVRLELGRTDLLKIAFYGDCCDHDVVVASKNLIQISPYAPFITPAKTTSQDYGSVRKSYIECLQDRAIPIDIQRQMQSDLGEIEVVSMDTSHSPFLSAPAELADIVATLI